jgi:hypothetical protein
MEFSGYISRNRPALFDWLVFIVTFSLSFVYPAMSDIAFTPMFSWLMFATLVLYAVGAWLKHLPLYYRMIRNGVTPREIPYLLFLVIGHWIIIYTVILLSTQAVASIAGKMVSKEGSTASGIYFLFGFILSVLITWIVYHHRQFIKKEEEHSSRYLFYRELVGDIFLVCSVSVLTFVFWEKGIMTLFVNGLPKTMSEIWFIFLLLAICFVLFYLPLRYLYLVEDHSSRQTWQRFLLIFGFLLIRTLIGVLGR